MSKDFVPIVISELKTLSDSEFSAEVSLAFRNYASLLNLSRSPLAASDLIGSALVLDAVSPTTDNRGRALRVVLRWAVDRLAPGPTAHQAPSPILRPPSGAIPAGAATSSCTTATSSHYRPTTWEI